MAPPKTMAVNHQQQQYTNGQQPQQPASTKNQPSKVRNRKVKQQQQVSNNINEKLASNVASPAQQNGTIIDVNHKSSVQLNDNDNMVNHDAQILQQKKQVEPDIQPVINSITTNSAKRVGPINAKTSPSNNNSPSPSERTTVKHRKEAQLSLDSSLKLQTLNEKSTTQRNTAQNDNCTNNIASNETNRQQQKRNPPQSAQPTKSILTTSHNAALAAAEALVTNSNSLIASKHQTMIAADEPDDIDAGIELDGSSNSGSSVKDSSEDQMKSNSVSPVMSVQSPARARVTSVKATIASETTPNATTTTSKGSAVTLVKPQISSELKKNQPSVESSQQDQSTADVSTDQLDSVSASAACDGAISAPIISSSTSQQDQITTKKTTMSREELAKERQVIEEDEQLIQEKLENKQRKSSGGSACSLSGAASLTNNGNEESSTFYIGNKNKNVPKFERDKLEMDDQSKINVNPLKNDKSSSARSKIQFSANKGQLDNGGNGGLKTSCKNCGQHVYQMERMLAEKSLYHKQCFRCHQCKIQLRIDNYASHEGQVYCKSHHKQILQPQVRFNHEGDCDNVTKSTTKQADEYLLQRGRLSELTFSFLNSVTEGSRQRQMIICENEPVELSKDVVRSDTKIDDGINDIKLNLNNILKKFENGSASNDNEGDSHTPSSASALLMEKPRFNIKQKLAAFENNQIMPQDDSSSDEQPDKANLDKPVVGKLGNVANFLNRFNSQEDNNNNNNNEKATRTVKRSESLMGRLKKYESRIAGEKVDDDSSSSADEDDENKLKNTGSRKSITGASDMVKSSLPSPKKIDIIQYVRNIDPSSGAGSLNRKQQDPHRVRSLPKFGSIDLSSLKYRWENGDIKNSSHDNIDNGFNVNEENNNDNHHHGVNGGDDKINNNLDSLMAEKKEELFLIRQQLAQRKAGKAGSVKNIYENALREAEEQQKNQLASSRRDSSDLSALNGLSTSEIQQQLLQQKQNEQNITTTSNQTNTPMTSNINTNNVAKDHFQLNVSRRANKLKERFELGLINNSQDDSDMSDNNESPALSKLEQIRQEKLEDLSVFTDGEIGARQARSLFQQIDRRLSSSGLTPKGQQSSAKNFHNSRSTTVGS